MQDGGAVDVAGGGGFDVSGHEENFEGGVGLAQALSELASAEVGHDDVGEEEIDGARFGGMLGGETKRLCRFKTAVQKPRWCVWLLKLQLVEFKIAALSQMARQGRGIPFEETLVGEWRVVERLRFAEGSSDGVG